jgi:hypothetical protein
VLAALDIESGRVSSHHNYGFSQSLPSEEHFTNFGSSGHQQMQFVLRTIQSFTSSLAEIQFPVSLSTFRTFLSALQKKWDQESQKRI